MKTILKILLLYCSLLAIILMNSCDKNDDEDRISVTPQLPPIITAINPSSALVGEEVIITGTNFSTVLSDNAVSFNGKTAVISSITATSITTTVPEGATTGPVNITVKNFTSSSGPTFTVELPLHTITLIDPVDGAVGTTVTITGTNFSTIASDNIVNFNGTMATVTAATTTSITTSVPVGATTGPISVEIAGKTETGPDFTVLAISNLIISIDNENDDAEEVAEVDPSIDPGDPIPNVGDMDLTSSDLEFGEISSNQGLQNIGLRFNNVTIPQGATINEAKIQFKCDDDGAAPVEITIYGEAIDNALTFDATNGGISSRPLTTANVVWNVAPWLAAGDRLEAQKTVDLSSIIQEIVNRPGWVSGNSISIIMKHTGVSIGATSSSTGREAENYSSSTADDGAELSITYQ